jgi:hypothetical protein
MTWDGKRANVVNRLLLVSLATATLAVSAASAGDPPRDTLRTPPRSAEYVKWRDYIRPTPAEQSHRTIPWRASVLHGLFDAQTHDKPILLFLMNGHPLGCS